MCEKRLAAVAIGCLILLPNAGAPRSSTLQEDREPSRGTVDGPFLAAVSTTSSRKRADLSLGGLCEAAANQVAQTQEALREFKTDWMDDFIPEGAVPLLKILKHGLRDLVMTALNEATPDSFSPETIQAMVLSSLSSGGASVELPDCSEITDPPYRREYVYGDIYELSVRQPTADPDLLAITTTLGICCGEDTSLYVARRRGDRWAILIAEEANDYTEVSRALGYFQYYVAEPDALGQFFLVTAHVTPWCTSNWQGLRYRVTRPGHEPYHPAVLLAAQGSIYLDNDPALVLSGEPTGFSLKFRAQYSLDLGIMIRDHIIRYQVQGNQLTRINPVAASAEDFLDEWINMPWRDAARWSGPSMLPRLRRWHSFLHEKKSGMTDGLLFVQPCETARSGLAKENFTEWQIGLSLHPKKSDDSYPDRSNDVDRIDPDKGSSQRKAEARIANSEHIPSTLFFTVIRNRGGFGVKSIDPVRPPGCPGETPPEAFSRL